MSYGATAPCFAEYVQLQVATAKGITLVAAAGNELAQGNPLLFPASLPHVITVAAVGNDLKAPFFSSASAAIDLSAPGVGILTATPAQFDGDGQADGYEAVTGTSFAAPMVAAAAAWVRAAKPGYRADQVANVLRASARDLDRKGWDSATGYGLLNLLARALEPPARDRPARAQRRHGVDQRPRHRPRRPADLAPRRPAQAARARRQVRGPGRRLPARPPPAGARARDPAAALRQPRPRRLHPRRRHHRVDDEQLIGQSRRRGKRRDTLTLRNPSRRSRSAYLVVFIHRRTRTLDSRYELRVQRARR